MAGAGEARGGVAPTLAPPRSVTSDSDTAQGARDATGAHKPRADQRLRGATFGDDLATEGEAQGETHGARSSAVLLVDWRTVTRL